jgi:glycosyltransferase auxiliary protein
MLAERTDSDLGRHLLTIRGVQFIFGAQSDPLAVILRAGAEDPLVHGERARALGLHQSPIGAWVIAARDLGEQVLADERFGVRHPDGEDPQHHPGIDVWSNPLLCHVVPLDDAFVNLAAADYRRLAAAADRTLSATALRARGTEFADLHRAVLGELPGSFDLYRDFAVPAATRTVVAALGLPPECTDDLLKLHAGLACVLDAGQVPAQLATARRLLESVEEGRELIRSLLDVHPDTPLAGLAPEDAFAVGVLALTAAIELSATAIGNTVEALLANPEQWRLVRDDAALVPAAVSEAFRFSPPQRIENRIATVDIELADQRVEAGQRVVVLVDAANRDPAAFDEPNRFRIDRPDAARQITRPGGAADPVFGALVRLQAETAVSVLAADRPELSPAGEPLRRIRSAVLRGFLTFPVA